MLNIQRLGIDGNVTSAIPDFSAISPEYLDCIPELLKKMDNNFTSDCCPPDLCSIDICGLVCQFIQLLPSGPLWDDAKRYVSERWRSDPVCDDFFCVEEKTCGHIVDHSVYTAKRLYYLLFNALWPCIRESNPYTACTTLDDWLDRYNWIDCVSKCRGVYQRELSVAGLRQEFVDGECQFVEYGCPEASEELETAVKRGIVVALTRLNLGIVKNLDSINFILSSLGAQVKAEKGCESDCDNICLILGPVNNLIEKSVCDPCPIFSKRCAPETIQSYIEVPSDRPVNYPARVYPGVINAEFLLRSILQEQKIGECQKIQIKLSDELGFGEKNMDTPFGFGIGHGPLDNPFK